MTAYLFSCENATCAVPEAHRELFRGLEDVVTSTAGWEPGALNLAQGFAMRFRSPLVHGDVTRLLVNLEKEGEECWSSISQQLPDLVKSKLRDRHRRSYQNTLEQRVTEDLRRHDTVVHVLIHTDPEMDGTVVLETSAKATKAKEIAAAWNTRLSEGGLAVSHLTGATPAALPASMEDKFPLSSYAQIVLRVSQSFFLNGHPWRWETLKKHLLETLHAATR